MEIQEKRPPWRKILRFAMQIVLLFLGEKKEKPDKSNGNEQPPKTTR